MKLPFFGLLSPRSPMEGLIDHYDKVVECVDLIKDSLQCYVAEGTCREFSELARTVDDIENQADKIKRGIRNRLPRRLFMPVEKTLFINYTSLQDNILDEAQECMYWLAMRPITVPEEFQKDLVSLLDDVFETITLLGPALESTVKFVYAEELSRETVKAHMRAVRANHQRVFKKKVELISRIYNSDYDFKDIHQLIHFVQHLHDMSHNSQHCAEALRAMIAK